RFVQSIRYAEIALGVGRGGGYRPHPPSQVLRNSYGDCKDKANLMKALLATIGIPSHLVTLYYGDADYVRESWPSPQQFNHCILAIELLHPMESLSSGASSADGRWLFFDPTDPTTPLGELPASERGSLALMVRPGTVGLTRLPDVSAEAD